MSWLQPDEEARARFGAGLAFMDFIAQLNWRKEERDPT
jgi:hypothetical protein